MEYVQGKETPEYALLPQLDADPLAWTPNRRTSFIDDSKKVECEFFGFLTNATTMDVFAKLTRYGCGHLMEDCAMVQYPVWDEKDNPRAFSYSEGPARV